MFCYGLRNWEGRRNGIIHFSVRVMNNLSSETKQEKDIKMMKFREIENGVIGFHVNHKKPRNVVIGIPC